MTKQYEEFIRKELPTEIARIKEEFEKILDTMGAVYRVEMKYYPCSLYPGDYAGWVDFKATINGKAGGHYWEEKDMHYDKICMTSDDFIARVTEHLFKVLYHVATL